MKFQVQSLALTAISGFFLQIELNFWRKFKSSVSFTQLQFLLTEVFYAAYQHKFRRTLNPPNILESMLKWKLFSLSLNTMCFNILDLE